MLDTHNFLHIARMLYDIKIPKAFKKIRLGDKSDGGYVLCDDFHDIDTAISIGIGGNVSFDYELAKRGIKVHQFDHTVSGPPVYHHNFNFEKLGWYEEPTQELSINLEKIIFKNQIDSNDILLKFDIEGAEWKNLQKIKPDYLKKFRFIVAEFHFFENIQDVNFYNIVLDVLNRLTMNHTLIHSHANNYGHIINAQGVFIPLGIELTFLRNDRTSFEPYYGPIPTSLDFPNDPFKPDIFLRY